MINIQPQTEVRLLKTPLEKEGNHTMTFSNITAQTSYFLSKTIKSYTDFTYQRETESLVVPDSFDVINTCNYIMYKNTGFTSKYFYAYITKMEYINENATRIYFEIDSLQTWYFNINYKRCFVEREHVNDDTIGLHTVPEELETGEYILHGEPASSYHADNLCLCLGESGNNGILVNNNYTGYNYRFFKTDSEGYAWGKLNQYKQTLQNQDIIQCIYPVPVNMINDYVNWNQPIGSTGLHYGILSTPSSTAYGLNTFGGSLVNTLGGNYAPVNNKLLCYPYRYILLSNNNGGNNTYRIEDFENNTPSFNVYGALVPSCSFTAVPLYYKNVHYNYAESLIGAKLPVCSWTSDVYTNWLTQNGINSNFAGIVNESEIKVGTSVQMLGADKLDKFGVANNIFGNMKEIYSHSLIPPTLKGNTNGGDVNYSLGNCNFKMYYYVIKEEYARIIDRYFNVYGYKVNDVKVPNITGRANWNYVKTIGCNFTGDIPQQDIENIRNLFDSGITFWHNEENFLNYSASNGII